MVDQCSVDVNRRQTLFVCDLFNSGNDAFNEDGVVVAEFVREDWGRFYEKNSWVTRKRQCFVNYFLVISLELVDGEKICILSVVGSEHYDNDVRLKSVCILERCLIDVGFVGV